MEHLIKDFVAKYEATYGQDSAYTAAGVEFVTFRVVGTIPMERPKLAGLERSNTLPSSLIGRRNCYFADTGHVATDIHDGERILNEQRIVGPAIVQRPGDTVVLPPGTYADADRHGGLTITWHEATQ
jgi:N-methylhydantoinase A